MSFEDELRRELQAKAAAARVNPDVNDLSARIRTKARSAARREHLALGAALVVLAASVGGLGAALANRPHSKPTNSAPAGYGTGGRKPTERSSPALGPAAAPPVVVFSRVLASGVTVSATSEAFSAPVAITSEWSASSECASGETVVTDVGQAGSFGGATSVAELPALEPNGLEVLSSGVLQLAGGADWWVTAAAGSSVTSIAVENIGGQPVTVAPAHGIAVLAGPLTGPNAPEEEMSIWAEGSGGRSDSMGFLLGSGSQAEGAVASMSDSPPCAVLRLPAEPQSAASSQPAEPAMAAASIIAAFQQAYAGDPLLGFAANLDAVNGGSLLSLAANGSGERTVSHAPAGTGSVGTGSRSNGAVQVREVSFLSAATAEVVYRFGDDVLLTGRAVLTSTGVWKVALSTFCGDVRAGYVSGEIPAVVSNSCAGLP